MPPPNRMMLRSRDSLKYFASALAQSELNSRMLAPPPALNANPECEIDSSKAASPSRSRSVELLLGVVEAEAAGHVRTEARGLHRRLIAQAERADHRLAVGRAPKPLDRDGDDVGNVARLNAAAV